MSHPSVSRASGVVALAVVLACIGLSAPLAAQANQRPIEDFVNAQGTPTPFTPFDYIGWLSAANDPPIKLALVDYAGVGNRYLVANGHDSLGTEFSGTVRERPLSDGRAEVVVILHTRNALTWVVDIGDEFDFPGDFNCATCPLLFGHRETEVLVGQPAAVGDSFFQAVLINTGIGDPLPDLLDAFVLGNALPGQELVAVSFVSKAFGTLPDGTLGKAEVTQMGRFMTPFMGALADGFPVENVDVKRIGRPPRTWRSTSSGWSSTRR